MVKSCPCNVQNLRILPFGKNGRKNNKEPFTFNKTRRINKLGYLKADGPTYLKSSCHIKTSKKIFESGELEPNSVISILETTK